jgi:hypothetical protein
MIVSQILLLFFSLPIATVLAAWPRLPQWPHWPHWQVPWIPPVKGGGIPQHTYDELVRFTKYSAAVYIELCPRPLGNVLVREVNGIAYSLTLHNAKECPIYSFGT